MMLSVICLLRDDRDVLDWRLCRHRGHTASHEDNPARMMPDKMLSDNVCLFSLQRDRKPFTQTKGEKHRT
jgi:hypothetical protein